MRSLACSDGGGGQVTEMVCAIMIRPAHELQVDVGGRVTTRSALSGGSGSTVQTAGPWYKAENSAGVLF